MGSSRALLLCASALAVAATAHGAAPPRPTGGLAFGPATLVDPVRSTSSPVLRVDGAGALWVTGQPARPLRSTDGGDSFRARSGIGTGASDVVAAGTTVVAAAEAGGSVAIAGSDDGGSTWRPGHVESLTGVTRPWLAADGSNVFLAVTTPAGTEILSAGSAELRFADAGAPGPEAASTRCGRLVFDPVRRNLYLPCARGNAVELTTGHVPAGRRAGIVFGTTVAAVSPGGAVAGPLPSLAVDAAGETYAVWVDAGSSSLYAARPGSAPVAINGAGADVTAIPVAVGGAPGTFAVAYLGTEVERDPNTLPDARADPRGAAAVRWYGFAALVSDLGAASATVVQQRTTAKPVAFGRVCTACARDPVLGDTLGVGLEPGTGALRIALADASDPRHAPAALLVRQLAGPTVFGQSVSRPAPANGVVDGTGDAPAPGLDLTKLEVRQATPATLRVRMSVASAASLVPPPGVASAVWLTRFQILSRGQAGEAAYRALYAAAISTGGPPRFVAGEIACAESCGLSSTRPATGRIEGATIVVDVNLAALAATVPIEGDLLYNVSGFTFDGEAGGNPVDVVDSLASFDYRLDQRIGATTRRGRRITLRGTVGGGAATVDVFENRTGRVVYRDRRARVSFRSTRITRVAVRARTATISGTGMNGRRLVSFRTTLVDRGSGGRRDSFALRLSSGYARSGRLASGDIRIRASG